MNDRPPRIIRPIVSASLLVFVPITVWSLGLASDPDLRPPYPALVLDAIKALILAEVLLLGLFVPLLAVQADWGRAFAGLCLLITLPLPFWGIAALSSVIDAGQALECLSALLATASLLLVLMKWLCRHRHRGTEAAIILGGFQSALLAAIVASLPLWPYWTGPVTP